MLIQLSPTIPFDTPRGPASAHFLLDYGEEHHLLWVCFVDATGECWTWRNPEIKLRPNPTMRAQKRDDGDPVATPSMVRCS